MEKTNFSLRNLENLADSPYAIPLAILVALALILFVFKKLKGNESYSFVPYGRINSPHQIKALISQALNQYRPFEVQIGVSHDRNRPTLKCIPVEMDKDSLTLEAVGLKKLSEHWLNRDIVVFFRIAAKGEFSYHTFSSKIMKISAPKADVCHIKFPLPEVIDNRQQRAFLRIKPPLHLVFGDAVWYGDTMPSSEGINDLTEWPRPVLYSIPDITQQFEILDLSAGGMRLIFPHETVKKMDLKLTTLDRFIVMMDLYDPEDMERIRFWIKCRSQRISVEPPTHDVHLGAKFLAWGKPRKPENSKNPGAIEWFRISTTQEVAPVSNWIMRRHLAMFQEENENNAPLDKLEIQPPQEL